MIMISEDNINDNMMDHDTIKDVAGRIDVILQNPEYISYVNLNSEAEKDRIFCRHNMAHFLDVARIGMILNLEEGYGIDRELIYAAALLHDIGRWKQYRTGEDHAAVSAELCLDILIDSGFDDGERKLITAAVASHRDESVKEEKSLRGLIYRADKLSRPCYACDARDLCRKKSGSMNLSLSI